MDRTVLILDLETESHNKGAWTDPRNSVLAIGYQIGDGPIYTVVPSPDEIHELQQCIYACDLMVLFNAKFDMHWLVNIGIDLTGAKIYDLQVADFIVNGMTNPYPSLDDMAFRYLSERKLDFVKLEYWEKGKLTSEVPLQNLMEYLHQDVALTKKLFELDIVPERQSALFNLLMEDLLVLFEMERNGIRYDREKSLAMAGERKLEIQRLFDKHFAVHGLPDFNWGSPDQLSALLFGGSIKRKRQVPVGTFKSGAKAGQVKYKWEEFEVQFPRRYQPINRTPAGKWSTDDDTLSKLGGDELIADLKTIRALQKEVNTYLEGLPRKQDEMNYGQEYIYTNLNLCVTDTGRLSLLILTVRIYRRQRSLAASAGMSDPHPHDQLVEKYEAKLKEKRNDIKDLKYLVNRLSVELAEAQKEIRYLKNFPDAALKAAAHEILKNQNLRRESMARWRKDDDAG